MVVLKKKPSVNKKAYELRKTTDLLVNMYPKKERTLKITL